MRNLLSNLRYALLTLVAGAVLFGGAFLLFHGAHTVDVDHTTTTTRTCHVRNATPVLHSSRTGEWTDYVMVTSCGVFDITEQQFDTVEVGKDYRLTTAHHELTDHDNLTSIQPA